MRVFQVANTEADASGRQSLPAGDFDGGEPGRVGVSRSPSPLPLRGRGATVRGLLRTTAGRILSHVVAAALIVPSFTLGFASRRAEAQIRQNPVWAVTDLKDVKNPGSGFGQAAGEAISAQLARSGRYDVLPRETVDRTVRETLQLTQPLANTTNLLRVGQELRVATIVSGDIVDYKVASSAQGRQAFVSMRIVAYDVASGIAVNGATVSAQSTVRSGDVSEEVLVRDAISAGANAGVQKIISQTLPVGTIQNTYQDAAILNQGSRSGFKTGQELVITRGREQVATARVSDVQPTSSTIRVTRSFKGLQPGDTAQVIFTPDTVVPGFNANGTARVQRSRSGNNLSGIIAVALVLGLVLILATGSNGSSQEVTDQFTARATNDVAGGPTVQLNWQTNGFAKGNSQKVQWQIYRSPNDAVPILVLPGTRSSAIDQPGAGGGSGTNTGFAYTFNSVGYVGQPCNQGVGTGPVANAGLEVGRPYQYSIELVYALNSIDLPSQTTGNTGGLNGGGNGATTTSTTAGGTTGTGGGTGGLNGGGNTGGGTTTGGTTGGQQLCYFVSARTQATGPATALIPPAPKAPLSQISAPTPFTFQSSATALYPVSIEYVVQFSTSPAFPRNLTYTTPAFVNASTGIIATESIDTLNAPVPAFIRNATTFYYRIGARNLQDRPGPVPDSSTGLSYVFGPGVALTRPGAPPPPPSQ